jgi:integrase
MAFRGLAPRGQAIRRRALEATYYEPVKPGSPHKFADCPIERFRTQAARVLRDLKVKWVTVDGERIRTNLEAANCRLKFIRGVLNFAKEEFPDLVERNWASDVDYFDTASDGFHSWTLDEIAQYEDYHPIGSKPRLAMALGLYTGQRRGDAVRLGPIMERAGLLQVIQEKNRRKNPVTAWVPIVPALKRIIDATPTGDLFYLAQDNGQPYKKESFGNLFREWCDQAGLQHCSFHGLRKACVVRLIMEDCTPHQIMAITGHQTLKEIDRYARKYMREQAANQVLLRWLNKHAS